MPLVTWPTPGGGGLNWPPGGGGANPPPPGWGGGGWKVPGAPGRGAGGGGAKPPPGGGGRNWPGGGGGKPLMKVKSVFQLESNNNGRFGCWAWRADRMTALSRPCMHTT
jgi:hypothetical protein